MSTKKLQILDSLVLQAENAKTLDGKPASEFASASDVEQLQAKCGKSNNIVQLIDIGNQFGDILSFKSQNNHISVSGTLADVNSLPLSFTVPVRSSSHANSMDSFICGNIYTCSLQNVVSTNSSWEVFVGNKVESGVMAIPSDERGYSASLQFQPNATGDVEIRFVLSSSNSGTSIQLEADLMINEGSEVLPFEPPVQFFGRLPDNSVCLDNLNLSNSDSTLGVYGIQNAYTKDEVDNKFNSLASVDEITVAVQTLHEQQAKLEENAELLESYDLTKKLDNKENVIKTIHLENYSVNTNKLQDGAVTRNKIENGAVGENEISTELAEKINATTIGNSFFYKSPTQLVKLADCVTEVNGLTITIKNNHVSIQGTAKDRINEDIIIDTGISQFEANKNYAISFQNVQGDENVNPYDGMFIWVGSDDNKHLLLPNKDSSTIINTATDKAIRLKWNLSAEKWNKEFDFKIELGVEATPFEPYYVIDSIANGSISKERLSKDVQNMLNSKSNTSLFLQQSSTQLIKLADIDTEINGLQISIKNNHVSVKGTAESAIYSSIGVEAGLFQFEADTEYTISLQNITDNTANYIGMFCNSQPIAVWAYDTFKNLNFAEDTALSLNWNIQPGTYDKEFDFKIEYGTEATPFEPYYVVKNIANGSISKEKLANDVLDDLDAILNKVSYFSFTDITDESDIKIGGLYTNSYTITSSDEWDCSRLIACNSGDIFRFTSKVKNGAGSVVKCYRQVNAESYELVGSYFNSNTGSKSFTDKVFIVPEGVSHIAFNCWARVFINEQAVGQYDLKIEKATPYTNNDGLLANSLVTSLPSTELFGKTIYSDGDSIALGSGANNRSYANLLADKYDMELTSKAIANTTLAVYSGNGDNKSIYERVVSNVTAENKYDYIFLDGGTNDVTRNIPLGVMTDGVDDEFDTSTILGALEATCKHLNTVQLTAKKLFIFVTNRVEKLKVTKDTFAEMKKVLNKWGIPYIDLSNVNSLGRWADPDNPSDTVAKDYYADDIHPNLKAYKEFYLPYIEKALLYGGYIST